MFIQTEQTPNPASLKFLPGRAVTDGRTVNITSAADAQVSDLAQRLFEVDGVTGILFGADFVTVSKSDDKDWFFLKPSILGALMEHYVSDRPLFKASQEGAAAGTSADEDDDEIVSMIKELLDTRVRPAVAQDGGDIIFHGFDQGVLYLVMHGACAGCPSSTMTLKSGIENLMKHYIPEVLEVRAVN